MQETITYINAIESAASLREAGEHNTEYERGQRETLARMFPGYGVTADARADIIEQEIQDKVNA